MAFDPRRFFGNLANKVTYATPSKSAPARTLTSSHGVPPGFTQLLPKVHTPQSSWVVSFEYLMKGDGRTGLAVEFKSGVKCFYPGTETWLYNAMDRWASKGKCVHKFIYKKEKYEVI